jgi:sulfite oxidase
MAALSFPVTSRREFLKRVSTGTLGLLSVGAFSSRLWGDEAGRQIVHSREPMNSEPVLTELVKSWVTPVESFFIRSHGNTPRVEATSYRLSVEGLVEHPLSLSLAELSSFAQQAITATLTCAGNRRAEHSRIKPVKGVQWREGAIGNAHWSGTKLSDLLRTAGLRDSAKHVWFDGLDRIEEGGHAFAFGGSIPIEKALDDRDGMPGALVVTTMNGQPLTPDHGFPVRMVVPGYIGARSVKWLHRIVVSDRPSPNHYVADVYKLVDDGNALEVAETAPIYRMPLNAAICTPTEGATIPIGRTKITGYALPPGIPGVVISRVEVSADGGSTWINAHLQEPSQAFCWRLWSADVPIIATTKELIVRATDSRGEVQPETVRWNLKGYLFNAWHRVGVKPT